MNGKMIKMNKWDEKLGTLSEIKQTKCGENRFLGVKNILEFYLTEGCTLYIRERDAIQTLVRMEWTMDEFFADGGTTKFVDRLSGALGIHASDVKVVSVYKGSLIVSYDIEVANDKDGTKLESLKKEEKDMFATGKMELGAPLLDVKRHVKMSIDPDKIITDGVVTAKGYNPIIITPTITNYAKINQGNILVVFLLICSVLAVVAVIRYMKKRNKNTYKVDLVDGDDRTKKLH